MGVPPPKLFEVQRPPGEDLPGAAHDRLRDGRAHQRTALVGHGDVCNGLMAIPNLFSRILSSERFDRFLFR